MSSQATAKHLLLTCNQCGPMSDYLDLQELVGKAVSEGPNQYTNLQGIPQIRKVLQISAFPAF